MTDKAVGFMNPKSLEEAMKCAELIAASDMVPKTYKNKPGDILVAGQMGAELGVSWLQALQGICVINGNPSVWGDLALALVKSHPHFESMKESYDEDTRTATCTIKRKNEEVPTTQTFSWADACAAGLQAKDTYQKYRRRMLQMRARSWAMRDCMPDALKGLKIAEEQVAIEGEYKVVDDEPTKGMSGLEAAIDGAAKQAIEGPKADGKHPEGSPEWWASLLLACTSRAQLEKVGYELRAADKETSDNMRGLYETHWETLLNGDAAAEPESIEEQLAGTQTIAEAAEEYATGGDAPAPQAN